MAFYGWRPYVPVVERRRKALREMEKRKTQGHAVSPVNVAGRAYSRVTEKRRSGWSSPGTA